MTLRLLRRSYRRAGRLVPRDARLRARAMVLPSGGAIAWHSTEHREELLIAIEGTLSLEVRNAASRRKSVSLRAGQSVFLPRRTMHRVVNRSSRPGRYLYVTASTV